jgi:hypothetical protein
LWIEGELHVRKLRALLRSGVVFDSSSCEIACRVLSALPQRVIGRTGSACRKRRELRPGGLRSHRGQALSSPCEKTHSCSEAADDRVDDLDGLRGRAVKPFLPQELHAEMRVRLDNLGGHDTGHPTPGDALRFREQWLPTCSDIHTHAMPRSRMRVAVGSCRKARGTFALFADRPWSSPPVL